MNKKELILKAFEDADNLVSDLPKEQMDVPALTSIRIRHLLNNLGKLGKNYLEVGVHKGGTHTAFIAGNSNLEFIASVDCFLSDKDFPDQDKAEPIYRENLANFKPRTSEVQVVVADSFEINPKSTFNGRVFDVYLYDGGHAYEQQKMALTHYKEVLADELILIVDDFDWDEVQQGTFDGIQETGYTIEVEHIVKGNDHDNDGWWNGYGVFLLKPK
jgi:hypothetical protein